MQQFELKSFGTDAMGPEKVDYVQVNSESAARSAAGRLARKIKGPVDLARAGGADWADRYMTTAIHDESGIWAAGYRFERLI